MHCLVSCDLNNGERKRMFDEIQAVKPRFEFLDPKSKIYIPNE